jgi:hypothetical protein
MSTADVLRQAEGPTVDLQFHTNLGHQRLSLLAVVFSPGVKIPHISRTASPLACKINRTKVLFKLAKFILEIEEVTSCQSIESAEDEEISVAADEAGKRRVSLGVPVRSPKLAGDGWHFDITIPSSCSEVSIS